MPRRFIRAVRVAQIVGAAVAVIVLGGSWVCGGVPAGETPPGPTSSSRT